MQSVRRAIELAEEHGMHVVRVALRGPDPDELAPALLAEVANDVAALMEAELHPIWGQEECVDDDGPAVLLLVDGLAQDIKASLVRLEDEHWLGGWVNLDLATTLDDGRVALWHGSPMRPEPRPLPEPSSLQAVLPDHFAR